MLYAILSSTHKICCRRTGSTLYFQHKPNFPILYDCRGLNWCKNLLFIVHIYFLSWTSTLHSYNNAILHCYTQCNIRMIMFLHFFSQIVSENSVRQVKEEARIQAAVGHHSFIAGAVSRWQTKKRLYIRK